MLKFFDYTYKKELINNNVALEIVIKIYVDQQNEMSVLLQTSPNISFTPLIYLESHSTRKRKEQRNGTSEQHPACHVHRRLSTKFMINKFIFSVSIRWYT